jgi:hypothetical protein
MGKQLGTYDLFIMAPFTKAQASFFLSCGRCAQKLSSMFSWPGVRRVECLVGIGGAGVFLATLGFADLYSFLL